MHDLCSLSKVPSPLPRMILRFYNSQMTYWEYYLRIFRYQASSSTSSELVTTIFFGFVSLPRAPFGTEDPD